MTKKQKHRRWTDKEIEFLRQNRKKMSYRQMANALDRTPETVGYAIHHYLKKSVSSIIEENNDIKLQDKDVLEKPIQDPLKDFFVIDFDGYEALFQKVIKIAEENFRTPQQQALFMIHEYCQRYKSAD